MQNYHLVPEDRQWKLTREGSDAVIGSFGTKQEAVESCSRFLHDREGSLKIHKADGTIEEERTYPRAADPVRSPG
jgi:hypothetical protein